MVGQLWSDHQGGTINGLDGWNFPIVENAKDQSYDNSNYWSHGKLVVIITPNSYCDLSTTISIKLHTLHVLSFGLCTTSTLASSYHKNYGCGGLLLCHPHLKECFKGSLRKKLRMDVISVLGNAIDYVKLLQERVEFLEEQIQNKPSSAPELSELSMDEISSSPTSTLSSESSQEETSYSPEIKVRVADRAVLVKVQCLMHKGVLFKVLDTMEKFDMFITNVNSVSFGPMLDMTIVAQMEDGCCLKSEDLVKNIKTSLRHFY